MIHLHSDGAHTSSRKHKAFIFSWAFVVHRDKTELFHAGDCMTTHAGQDWLHAGSGYAEYLGIYEGLLYCKGQAWFDEDIFSYCDNQALVKHLNGVTPVTRNRALKFYRGEVQALVKLFKSVHFKYIDRKQNGQAHRIATQYQRVAKKRLYGDGWHGELVHQVLADAPQI